MNKKIIITSLLFLLSVFAFFILNPNFNRVINDLFPIAEYQNNDLFSSDICNFISNNDDKNLCLSISDKNFNEALKIISKVKGYKIDSYPWYDFPYYSNPRFSKISNWTNLLVNQKKYNSKSLCEDIISRYSLLPEDYYFCRAFVENPNFCDRINYLTGPSEGICYQDAAFIWEDPSLCQKATYRDFCYIRLALKKIED